MLSPTDEARYAATATEMRAFAAALPPPLPDVCAPLLAELLAGEFARLAALLPWWLGDLLPVPEPAAARLSAAQLFGWWYAAAHDAALDGQAPPQTALAGGPALLRALAIYAELALPPAAAWSALEAAEARAAAAYARELASRPGAGPITMAHVAAWLGSALRPEETRRDDTLVRRATALVAERGASMLLGPLAQAELAGLGPDDPRRAALDAALTALMVARQMSDDAGDWPDDLRAGRLSTVTVACAAPLVAGGEPVPVERLAARLASDEGFWAFWWAAHRARCAEGAAALVPWGRTHLAAMLAAEAARGTAAARAGAAWRAEARALLGVAGGEG